MRKSADVDGAATYAVTYFPKGAPFRRCDACVSFDEARARAEEVVSGGSAPSATVVVACAVWRVDAERGDA